MAFSQGSRSSLSLVVESTFGTTPAGNFINIPFSSTSLNMSNDVLNGTDIQADRMQRVTRLGNERVAGDIVVDLRSTEYDSLLESAMMNTWATNVLKVGTTPKFFSIEDYAADIDQARLFTGMSAGSMGVSLAPNQMVTTTFGMVGKSMTIGQTQKTQTAAGTDVPFDAYSGDISIGNVGSPTASAIITALDFTIDNAAEPTFVIGDDSAPSIEAGMATVEGTMTAYFEDAALINRYLNETLTAIQVSVSDSVNTYTFDFPSVKITSADVGVDGPSSRMITMAFVALHDTAESTSLKITRSIP